MWFWGPEPSELAPRSWCSHDHSMRKVPVSSGDCNAPLAGQQLPGRDETLLSHCQERGLLGAGALKGVQGAAGPGRAWSRVTAGVRQAAEGAAFLAPSHLHSAVETHGGVARAGIFKFF